MSCYVSQMQSSGGIKTPYALPKSLSGSGASTFVAFTKTTIANVCSLGYTYLYATTTSTINNFTSAGYFRSAPLPLSYLQTIIETYTGSDPIHFDLINYNIKSFDYSSCLLGIHIFPDSSSPNQCYCLLGWYSNMSNISGINDWAFGFTTYNNNMSSKYGYQLFDVYAI